MQGASVIGLAKVKRLLELTQEVCRDMGGDSGVMTLVDRYYARQSQLHGECFYLGLCEPADATERRIRETAGYIRDAERLAYG